MFGLEQADSDNELLFVLFFGQLEKRSLAWIFILVFKFTFVPLLLLVLYKEEVRNKV